MTKAAVTEKQVKARIKSIVKLIGKYEPVYMQCPMTFGYGESGHPDFLVLIDGTLIGIEAKRDRNNHHSRPELKAKPNEVAQALQAKKIKRAGGEWICIHKDNLDELVNLMFDVANIADSSDLNEEDANELLKLTRG